ncbi:MAG: hypothetical protein AAB658_09480, partial [Chloroflexota bacterium]
MKNLSEIARCPEVRVGMMPLIKQRLIALSTVMVLISLSAISCSSSPDPNTTSNSTDLPTPSAQIMNTGKLEPALYDRLQNVTNDVTLEVGIWVANQGKGRTEAELYAELAARFPEAAEAMARGTKPMDVGDPELSNKIQEAYSELVAQDVATRLQPLVEWLQARKINFTSFAGMPSLVATLSKSEILELATRDDVATIYLIGAQETPVVTPLDGKISFTIEEVGGAITIQLQTLKTYGTSSNKINTSLDMTKPHAI